MSEHPFRWRTYLPELIAAGWIVFDLLLLIASRVTKEGDSSGLWLVVVLALSVTQLTCGGLWAAFGPGKASVRIPLVLAGTALSVAAFFRQMVSRNLLELEFIVFFLGILVTFQICLVALGLLVKLLYRLQAGWEDEPTVGQEAQFGVRDILYWMAAVGVLITVCRFSFQNVQIEKLENYDLLEGFLVATVLIGASLAQAFLAGWVSFPPKRFRTRWILGFLASPLLAAVCSVPLAIGWGKLPDFLAMLVLLELQYLLVWSLLAFLARQGLRVVEK